MKFSLEKIFDHLQLMDFHGKRVVFYEDWARSMEAGELLSTFLKAELEISMSKQTADSSRAFALKQMLRRMNEGEETMPSQIVGLSMPANDMMMLAAGDSAKEHDLIKVLRDLCAALNEQAEAKKVIFKSMITPMLLVPGMAIFAYVLSSQSIPIIEKVAPQEVWTTFNNSVRVFANVINHAGAYVALAVALFGSILWYSLSRWTGRVRFRMERIRSSTALLLMPVMPWLLPLSIYRDFQAVMMLSSLAVLLKSGRTLHDALELIGTKATPYLQYHIRRILNYIDEYPLEVSAAFSSGILSPKVSARLATISRTTKGYEDVLIAVGTTGAVEIRNQVGKTAAKLNFVFLIAATSVLLFLYLGQMSITTSMQHELDPITITKRKMEKEQQMGK